ncbi:MAG TPA: CorA family divalent cation transporter, partial [Patescibacteria group bacterium]|nr:CorA family divalent cation transporter [Patescibacteria group bacterium]
MIKYYQRTITDQKLRKLKKFQVGTLIHVVNPKDDEIDFLSKQLKLDIDIIKDALDPHEAPRMEIKKDITYVFTRVPRQDASIRHISTFPVMFTVGKDFLLIFSQENTDFLLDELRNNKNYRTTQRTKLFISIFFEIENFYSDLLNKISKQINYFGLNVGVVKDQDIVSFVRYEVILNEFISALLPVRHVLSSIISGKALDLYQ